MVTLLLTFFVLMVALSNSDQASLEMFMIALSREGLTAEQFWEIRDRYDFEDMDYESWDEMFPYPDSGEDDATQEEEDMGGADALQELHDAMAEYIEVENLGDIIYLTFNGEFLLMTLASDILYESGRADVTPEMEANAEVIARMLFETFEPDDPFEIVVAGHTDDVPMYSDRYPSNWHLSMGRATNFLDMLIKESQLDPGLFYARGCGQYRPIASNETAEGRQMNRRVEVMVSLARDNPLWDRASRFN